MENSLDNQTQSSALSSPSVDDELDPRIQIELDRLNYANEAINHLELQLDEARKTLQELLEISHEELAQLEKSIGSAVIKSRSYYEARIKLREAKEVLTKAKHRFERAQALHVAAKELAIISADHADEAGISSENAIAWSETYRQAVEKAGDAEKEKYLADFDQQRAERVYFEIEMLVEKLEKDSRKSINKSKPYYEKKVEFNKELEFHKRKVFGLENCVNEAKMQYQQSLKNLERISNEIHEQRKHGKSLSDVVQEQVIIPEIKSIVPEPVAIDNLKQSQQKNSSDTLLMSCLLRTESLPAGVFSKTNNQFSPEVIEPIKRTSDFNDQFLLSSKQSTYSSLVNSSKEESKTFFEEMRDRVSSFSSQMTDDGDDRTGSLHVLSDDQIDHLASVYYPFSPEIGMTPQSFDPSKNMIPDSILF
ncbi:hypothetical protein I4U23_018532 [Adineta vaga]|nr:hypothetical protein I4U23_018532 [Adineta vaga]